MFYSAAILATRGCLTWTNLLLINPFFRTIGWRFSSPPLLDTERVFSSLWKSIHSIHYLFLILALHYYHYLYSILHHFVRLINITFLYFLAQYLIHHLIQYIHFLFLFIVILTLRAVPYYLLQLICIFWCSDSLICLSNLFIRGNISRFVWYLYELISRVDCTFLFFFLIEEVSILFCLDDVQLRLQSIIISLLYTTTL